MKVLMVLAVVLFGVWLWRSGRTASHELKQEKPQTSQTPLETVACPLCFVHVSMSDAVAGSKGLYCCLEHRRRAEP